MVGIKNHKNKFLDTKDARIPKIATVDTQKFIFENSKIHEQQLHTPHVLVVHWSWVCGAESQGQRATRTAIWEADPQ